MVRAAIGGHLLSLLSPLRLREIQRIAIWVVEECQPDLFVVCYPGELNPLRLELGHDAVKVVDAESDGDSLGGSRPRPFADRVQRNRSSWSRNLSEFVAVPVPQ